MEMFKFLLGNRPEPQYSVRLPSPLYDGPGCTVLEANTGEQKPFESIIQNRVRRIVSSGRRGGGNAVKLFSVP